jgi:hypothetical protein
LSTAEIDGRTRHKCFHRKIDHEYPYKNCASYKKIARMKTVGQFTDTA